MDEIGRFLVLVIFLCVKLQSDEETVPVGRDAFNYTEISNSINRYSSTIDDVMKVSSEEK